LAHDVLTRLATLIAERRLALADTSYTRQLLDAGPAKCARKLGEEAIETVLAGVGSNPEELRVEAADLLYHLLVLLESRNVPLSDVLTTLEARMSQSGLAEKAARKTS
jgi:phosphoribosyl-ATP pyrophosphohydrolase